MKTIRFHLACFMALLLFSGLTAFPVQAELLFLFKHASAFFPKPLNEWLAELLYFTAYTPSIMFYGTDWLAFAHIVITLFFIPVYLNPLKHKANLVAGMAACVLVFPLALICGPLRGIPFFHQLIDCTFGVLGYLYLAYILFKINRLKTPSHENNL